MSNIDAPQCSTGGESGWTLYLDDGNEIESSFVSAERFRRTPGSYRLGRSWKEEGHDEDENLSMVSDASSGPPYYEVEDWSCHVTGGGFAAGSGRSGKKKNKRQLSGGRHSHYEDTACSHQKNFELPNNHAPRTHALDFHPVYLTANLEDESEYRKHNHCQQSPVTDQEAASKKSSQSRKLV